MAHRIALVVLVMFLAAVETAIADDWPGPTVKAVVSGSGETVVRMIPGASVGDTYGFAGAAKGKFASAQWFRFRENRYELYQTIQLVNPVAPIHVAVANDGTLITLDNWHNDGFGASSRSMPRTGSCERSTASKISTPLRPSKQSSEVFHRSGGVA